MEAIQFEVRDKLQRLFPIIAITIVCLGGETGCDLFGDRVTGIERYARSDFFRCYFTNIVEHFPEGAQVTQTSESRFYWLRPNCGMANLRLDPGTSRMQSLMVTVEAESVGSFTAEKGWHWNEEKIGAVARKWAERARIGREVFHGVLVREGEGRQMDVGEWSLVEPSPDFTTFVRDAVPIGDHGAGEIEAGGWTISVSRGVVIYWLGSWEVLETK